MAKIGTEGTANTGAIGVAGEMAKGISTSTMTPGPSKVFAKARK